MNKKLLTAAIGAALVAGPMLAAQADVKIYGHMQVAIVNVDDEVNAVKEVIQGDDLGRSRFGVKSTTDLGGGLKGIAVWENKINLSDNVGGIKDDRQQYLAIKGNFGEIAFGRIPLAYKMTGGAKIDPFNATFLQARRAGGQAGGNFGANGFLDDMIRYTGKFGSISVNLQTSVDEGAGGNDGDTSLSIKYKDKNLELFAATSSDDSANKDNSKFGGSYKLGPWKVWAQFEDTELPNRLEWANSGKNDGTGSGASIAITDDTDFTLLGASYKMGSNTFVLQVGEADSKDLAIGKTDYLSVGVIHKFTKKTRVYAGFASTDIGGTTNQDVTSAGAGLRFDF